MIGRIADHDEMVNHDEDFNHYYRTGFEVAEIISESGRPDINDDWVDILDFASGFGRGTRLIRAFFLEANLHTQEVIPSAVKFYREAFNYSSSLSDVDYNLLDVTR